MKKLLAVIAAGLVVIAASQLVTTVAASNKSGKASITRRVAALERKVRVLQGQMNVVRGDLACQNAVVGVSHYGNPPANQGYLYTNDGANVFLTTGLDLTPNGQTPFVWVPVVDSTCVTGAPSHFKALHLGQRMMGRAPFELRSTK